MDTIEFDLKNMSMKRVEWLLLVISLNCAGYSAVCGQNLLNKFTDELQHLDSQIVFEVCLLLIGLRKKKS